MSEVLTFFKEQYPFIFILLIVVYGVGFLVWKFARFYQRFEKIEDKLYTFSDEVKNLFKKADDKHDTFSDEVKNIFKKVENKYDTFSDEVKNIFKKVDDKNDTLSEEVDKLYFNVSSIIGYLVSKDKDIDRSVFEHKSQIRLSALGKEALEITGSIKYADENLDYLLSRMEDMDIKSPLDVESIALTIILHESNSDEFVPIKNYIFQNPKYKKINLNLPTITRGLGIYLRDKYFERYPAMIDVEGTVADKKSKLSKI